VNRFIFGTRFSLRRGADEEGFVVDHVAPDKKTLVARSLRFGHEVPFVRHELDEAFVDGRLLFEIVGRHAKNPRDGQLIATEATEPDFSPPRQEDLPWVA